MESFLTAIEKQQNGDRLLQIEGLGTASDEEVVEAIKGWTGGLDGLAIVCKNIPPIIDELKRLRQAGKHVMALVSDLESSARSAYLGIDNRATGNVAAYDGTPSRRAFGCRSRRRGWQLFLPLP
jgi:ABC-type sugar transport system substrate-binding protein